MATQRQSLEHACMKFSNYLMIVLSLVLAAEPLIACLESCIVQSERKLRLPRLLDWRWPEPSRS